MVIGAVVVGYRRECTRELTQEQQGTLKKFKGKIVVTSFVMMCITLRIIMLAYHGLLLRVVVTISPRMGRHGVDWTRSLEINKWSQLNSVCFLWDAVCISLLILI